MLIRNLDDELVENYRKAAKRNGRSLEAELREVLRAMQPLTRERVAQLIETSRRIRAMTPDVPQTPSEDLIRADRDGFREG